MQSCSDFTKYYRSVVETYEKGNMPTIEVTPINHMSEGM